MVIPSRYTLLDDFLTPDEHRGLLEYAVRQETEFVASQVTSRQDSRRQSKVLNRFDQSPWPDLMRDKLRLKLPDILQSLGLPPFRIELIDAQITAHNAGDYLKVHRDSGDGVTPPRELSYVYYFHREPKAFAGGELRIYDSCIESDDYIPSDSFSLIEPRNNSLVVFQSRIYHEVRPVHCATRAFEDSRFTINGWIRRKPELAKRKRPVRVVARALRKVVAGMVR